MRLTGLRIAVSVSVLAAACVLAAPASAQSAPAEDQAEPAPTDQQIVVTGSLISRPNNTAVSPIVSLSDVALKETGTATLVDALNQLPSFTTGGNASTGGQGTGGRASINLHGLGTNRNLVLLDGKRLPISDIAGNVDINILADAIIGGVDAITGGASAIYGSDALSGVVNFRTVRKLDGFKIDVLNSLSERGDAYRFNGSVAFGTGSAEDRGHVVAAFSYTKQDPLNGNSRDFFFDKTPSLFIGTGAFVPSATNAPIAAAVTALFNGYGVAGAGTLVLADPDRNRSEALAARLASHFGAGRVEPADMAAVTTADVDGIVNASPVGMASSPGLPLAEALITPRHWVADIVYFPLETELLRVARSKGCRVLDGSGMVVAQAAIAFEIITGQRADPERMARSFVAGLVKAS